MSKLSKEAREAKKKRDLEYAKTPRRRKMKAENQKKRREAIKKHGKAWLNGKDYDHEDGKFESVKRNRGNDGNGTKKESPINIKLFPGGKIKKSSYPTDYVVPSMNMSIKQFNEKSRKERRRIYKTKLK